MIPLTTGHVRSAGPAGLRDLVGRGDRDPAAFSYGAAHWFTTPLVTWATRRVCPARSGASAAQLRSGSSRFCPAGFCRIAEQRSCIPRSVSETVPALSRASPRTAGAWKRVPGGRGQLSQAAVVQDVLGVRSLCTADWRVPGRSELRCYPRPSFPVLHMPPRIHRARAGWRTAGWRACRRRAGPAGSSLAGLR